MKKITAVALVVILVVAGVTVFLTMDNKETEAADFGGELLIYGNANGDSVVDELDIKYIEGVISGDNEKTKFSDANNDKKVDEKDVQQVKDMIDRKAGLKVYYVNGMNKTTSVEWPLNKICVLSNSPQLMALAVGLDSEKIIGYTKADSILFASFGGEDKLLKSSSLQDYEMITANGIPDAVITGNTDNDVEDLSVKSLYDKAGIDLIAIVGMDGAEASSSALTLGYLVDEIPQSQAFSKWCHNMLDDIDKKVKGIAEKDRDTGLVWFGGFAAAGYDNPYSNALKTAGGIPIADWSGWKQLNEEQKTWIYNYDPDVIFRIYTMGYGADDTKRVALYEKYAAIIEPMDAYQNDQFALIDFNIPQILRIAYMAEFLYPDVFGEGYADNWHQQLVDIYGIDYKVDGQFIVTAEDVKEFHAQN